MDLSETLYLYEENDFTVDEVLVGQYLRNKRIAREFSSYYDLYQKYKKDYRVAQILAGNADADVRKRAKNAAFDERISLLGLLLDALQEKIRHNVELEDSLRRILPVLKEIKAELAADDSVDAAAILEHRADTLQQEMEQEDKANALSSSARKGYQLILHTLRQDAKELRMKDIRDANAAFLYIKESFDEQVGTCRRKAAGSVRNWQISLLLWRKFSETATRC